MASRKSYQLNARNQKRLRTYVKQAAERGYNSRQIEKTLLHSGWEPALVRQTIENYGKESVEFSLVLLIGVLAIFSVIATSLYFANTQITGAVVAGGTEWEDYLTATVGNDVQNLTNRVIFGNYKPANCADGAYVVTEDGFIINFTTSNEIYVGNVCAETDVIFDNSIYSPPGFGRGAEPELGTLPNGTVGIAIDNATSVSRMTYIIYYGKVIVTESAPEPVVPSNETAPTPAPLPENLTQENLTQQNATVPVLQPAFGILSGVPPTQGNPLLQASTVFNSTSNSLACLNQTTADTENDNVFNTFHFVKSGDSYESLLYSFNTNNTRLGAVTDYSKYSLNATLGAPALGDAAEPVWVNGSAAKSGGAYTFDGVNDIINISVSTPILQPATAVTIEAWVRSNSTLAQVAVYRSVISNEFLDTTPSGYGLALLNTAGRLKFRFQVSNGTTGTAGSTGSATVTSTTNMTPGRYYHVVGVLESAQFGPFSGSALSIYVNGSLENTTNIVPTFNINWADPQARFRIGADFAEQSGRHFNGSIDEVIVYNRSLTASEISEHFNLRYNNITSSELALDQVWSCAVTGSDFTNDSATKTSNTVTIINNPPTQGTPILQSSSGSTTIAFKNESIACFNQTTSDPDGNAVYNAFHFLVNNGSYENALFSFDTNNSAGTGKTKDYSEYGNNGTLGSPTVGDAGEPVFVADSSAKSGRAYRFDGINDFINVTDSPSLNFTNTSFTVEAWIRRTSVDQGDAIIAKGNSTCAGPCSSTNTMSYIFGTRSSTGLNLQIDISNGTLSDTLAGTASIGASNTFFHVAAVYNGTNLFTFVNGAPDANQATTIRFINPKSASTYIGAREDNLTGSKVFNGTIDEVRIYSRALSPAEILEHNNTRYFNITSDETTNGENWTCKVTASDTLNESSPATSNSILIGNGSTIGNITGLRFVLESDTSVDVSVTLQFGIKTVLIRDNTTQGANRIVARLNVSFPIFGTINLTGIVANASFTDGKSVLFRSSYPAQILGKDLWIPRVGNIGSVVICPNATSYADVNDTCTNVFSLATGQSAQGVTLSTTTFESDDYYIAQNVTGTGGTEPGVNLVPLTVNLIPAAPTPAGNNATVNVTVQNRGVNNATAFNVSLIADGVQIAKNQIASLASGAQTVTTFTWTTVTGLHDLKANVNPEGTQENNTADNNLTEIFGVDWPMSGQNDRRNGVSSAAASPLGTKRLWSIKLAGSSMSGSPAVIGDKVIVKTNSAFFFVINKTTGAQICNSSIPNTAFDGVLAPNNAFESGSSDVAYITTTGPTNADTHLLFMNTTSCVNFRNSTATLDGSSFSQGGSPIIAGGRVFTVYNESGATPLSAILIAINATSGSTLWTSVLRDTNFTAGDLAYWNGMVFASVSSTGSATVFAKNETNGATIWQFTTTSGNIVNAPTIVDGVVYFQTQLENQGWALNVTTGARIWNVTLTATNRLTAGSPIVADGLAIFPRGGDLAPNFFSSVIAVNATTGVFVWNLTITNTTFASEQSGPISYANGLLYIPTYTGKLMVVQAKKNIVGGAFGTEWFETQLAGDTRASAAQTARSTLRRSATAPAITNGTLIIGADGSDNSGFNLFALGYGEDDWPTLQHDNQRTGYSGAVGVPNDNSTRWIVNVTSAVMRQGLIVAGNIVYAGNGSQLLALNSTNGAILWNFKTSGIVGTATVDSGRVYFVSGQSENRTFALNATTGTHIWNFSSPVEFTQDNSPLVFGDKVYIGNNNGTMFVLNATNGTNLTSRLFGDSITGAASVENSHVIIAVSNAAGDKIEAWEDEATQANFAAWTNFWNFSTGTSCFYKTVPLIHGPLLGESSYYYDCAGNVQTIGVDHNLSKWTRALPAGPNTFAPIAFGYGRVFVPLRAGAVGFSALNQMAGTTEWSRADIGSDFRAIAVADGKVFVGTGAGALLALNATTGTTIWSYSSGAIETSGIAITDNAVYLSTAASGGQIIAFGPNRAPTIANVTVQANANFTLDNLNCTGTFSDPDGNPPSGSTFKWFENQSGAVTLLSPITQILDSDFTRENVGYFCQYTPSDGVAFGDAANSSTQLIRPLATARTYSADTFTENGSVTVDTGNLTLGGNVNLTIVNSSSMLNVSASTANLTAIGDGNITVTGNTFVSGRFNAGRFNLSFGRTLTTATVALQIYNGGIFTGGSGNHIIGSVDVQGSSVWGATSGLTTLSSRQSGGTLVRFLNTANFTHNSGTVNITNTISPDLIEIRGDQAGGPTGLIFFNLIDSGSATTTLYNDPSDAGGPPTMSVVNDFNVSSGIFDLKSSGVSDVNLNVTGRAQIFSTLLGEGANVTFGNVTVNANGLYNATNALTNVTGTTTVAGGTITLPSGNYRSNGPMAINVGGLYNITSGGTAIMFANLTLVGRFTIPNGTLVNATLNNTKFTTVGRNIEILTLTATPRDDADKRNITKYVNITNLTTNPNMDLNISYEQSLVDGLNITEANLLNFRHDGTNWTLTSGSGVDTVNNIVFTVGQTTFSAFAPMSFAFTDLLPTAINLNPAEPAGGQSVTINATITNRGNNITSTGFNVSFYVDGVFQAQNVMAPLAGGASNTTAFAWVAVSGTHDITIVADSATQIAESDESNNVLTKTIGVDWPQFHQNPTHSGFINLTNLPNTNATIWNRTLTGSAGKGHSAVSANGRIYLQSATGAGGSLTNITALNESTGAIIWSANQNCSSASASGGESAPMAVYAGRVYGSCATGSFGSNITFALNESTGTSIWSFNFSQQYSNGGPTIANGTVYIRFSGSGGTEDTNASLVALNASTGSIIWRVTQTDSGTPVTAYAGVYGTAAVSDGFVVLKRNNGEISAVRQNNGSFVWTFAPGNSIESEPLIADGRVFFGSNDFNFYALNLATGSQIWNFTATGAVKSPPVYHNNVVFFGDDSGIVFARNATNGSQIWNASTPDKINGLSVGDNKIFVATGSAAAGPAIALNETNGTEIWRRVASGGFSQPIITQSRFVVTVVGSQVIAFSPRQAPTIANVRVTADANFTLDNLNCTGDYSDPDSDPQSGSTFKWFENASGAITLLSPTTQILDSDFTRENLGYFCQYTPSDGTSNGAAVNSSTLLIAPLRTARTYSADIFTENGSVTVDTGNLTLSGANLTIVNSSSILNVSANTANLTILGTASNLTVAGGTLGAAVITGTFNAGAATLSLGSGSTASSYGLIVNSGGVFNGGTGSHTIGQIYDAGTVTLTSGVTTLNGRNPSSVAGIYALGATFNHGGGTVVFAYAGDNVVYDPLTLNNVTIKSGTTLKYFHDTAVNTLTVVGNLNVEAGGAIQPYYDTRPTQNLVANGTMNISGTFTTRDGTVTANGATIINSGGFFGTGGTAYKFDQNGALVVSSGGTLNAPNATGTFNISSEYVNMSGTFTSNNGKVIFDRFAGFTNNTVAWTTLHNLEIAQNAKLWLMPGANLGATDADSFTVQRGLVTEESSATTTIAFSNRNYLLTSGGTFNTTGAVDKVFQIYGNATFENGTVNAFKIQFGDTNFNSSIDWTVSTVEIRLGTLMTLLTNFRATPALTRVWQTLDMNSKNLTTQQLAVGNLAASGTVLMPASSNLTATSTITIGETTGVLRGNISTSAGSYLGFAGAATIHNRSVVGFDAAYSFVDSNDLTINGAGTLNAPNAAGIFKFSGSAFYNYGNFKHDQGKMEFSRSDGGFQDFHPSATAHNYTEFYDVLQTGNHVLRWYRNATILNTWNISATPLSQIIGFYEKNIITVGNTSRAGNISVAAANGLALTSNTVNPVGVSGTSTFYKFIATGGDWDWDGGGSGSKVNVGFGDLRFDATTGGGGVNLNITNDMITKGLKISNPDYVYITNPGTIVNSSNTSLLFEIDGGCLITGNATTYVQIKDYATWYVTILQSCTINYVNRTTPNTAGGYGLWENALEATVSNLIINKGNLDSGITLSNTNGNYGFTNLTINGTSGTSYSNQHWYLYEVPGFTNNAECLNCNFSTVGFEGTNGFLISKNHFWENNAWTIYGTVNASVPREGFKGANMTNSNLTLLNADKASVIFKTTFVENQDMSINTLNITNSTNWNITTNNVLTTLRNTTLNVNGNFFVINGTARNITLSTEATKFTASGRGLSLLNLGSRPADSRGAHNISKYTNITNISATARMDLNISYAAADVGTLNETILKNYRHNSSSWVLTNNTAVDTNSKLVYTTTQQIFSPFSPLSDTQPNTPILFNPVNASTIILTRPIFNWTIPADADFDTLDFEIQIANDSAFTQIVEFGNSSASTTGFFPTPPLVQNSGNASYLTQATLEFKQYFARVRAFDGTLYGNYSNVTTFNITTSVDCTLGVNDIGFGTVRPGTAVNATLNFNATGNGTLYNITSFSNINVNVTHKGTNMSCTTSSTCGVTFIPARNVGWRSNQTSANGTNMFFENRFNLTEAFDTVNKVAATLPPNNSTFARYWLTTITQQQPGVYQGNYTALCEQA